MQAQVIQAFGDPSVFSPMTVPKPTLEAGSVIIQVHATSVNPVDTKIRSGSYAAMVPFFPAILHADVAGVVTEVSPDVSRFKVGDEVFGCAGGLAGYNGALAEYMLADARLLAKKPRSLSMIEAAALPLVSITAWEALFEKISIQPRQKVLIHAGTGGVGHIAVQLAKWAGAEVTATVSSNETAKIARSLGAMETINYREETVAEYKDRITQGVGYDIVFDTVGNENLYNSMEAIKLYGDIVTTLAHDKISLSQLQAKSGSIHIVFMLIPLIHNVQRERQGKIMEKIAELADSGHVKPLIDSQQFSLDDISKAHAHLESGKAMGKIVVSNRI